MSKQSICFHSIAGKQGLLRVEQCMWAHVHAIAALPARYCSTVPFTLLSLLFAFAGKQPAPRPQKEAHPAPAAQQLVVHGDGAGPGREAALQAGPQAQQALNPRPQKEAHPAPAAQQLVVHGDGAGPGREAALQAGPQAQQALNPRPQKEAHPAPAAQQLVVHGDGAGPGREAALQAGPQAQEAHRVRAVRVVRLRQRRRVHARVGRLHVVVDVPGRERAPRSHKVSCSMLIPYHVQRNGYCGICTHAVCWPLKSMHTRVRSGLGYSRRHVQEWMQTKRCKQSGSALDVAHNVTLCILAHHIPCTSQSLRASVCSCRLLNTHKCGMFDVPLFQNQNLW